jgi:hypothetical protein
MTGRACERSRLKSVVLHLESVILAHPLRESYSRFPDQIHADCWEEEALHRWVAQRDCFGVLRGSWLQLSQKDNER